MEVHFAQLVLLMFKTVKRFFVKDAKNKVFLDVNSFC